MKILISIGIFLFIVFFLFVIAVLFILVITPDTTSIFQRESFNDFNTNYLEDEDNQN